MTDEATLTEYVVLERVKSSIAAKTENDDTPDLDAYAFNGHLWVFRGGLKARSAEEALRRYSGIGEGTYVAVPARSWKPVTVTVETQTKVVLS